MPDDSTPNYQRESAQATEALEQDLTGPKITATPKRAARGTRRTTTRKSATTSTAKAKATTAKAPPPKTPPKPPPAQSDSPEYKTEVGPVIEGALGKVALGIAGLSLVFRAPLLEYDSAVVATCAPEMAVALEDLLIKYPVLERVSKHLKIVDEWSGLAIACAHMAVPMMANHGVIPVELAYPMIPRQIGPPPRKMTTAPKGGDGKRTVETLTHDLLDQWDE